MLDDYYSHHPTIRLVRPVILTGTFHSDTRKVAHFLAGQTGLTLLDVDDSVAHQLGMSLVGLRHRDGPFAYLTHERAAIRRLVSQKPPGIIRAGRDALACKTTLEHALESADILFIRRGLDYEQSKYPSRAGLMHWLTQVRVHRHRPEVEDRAAHVIEAGSQHALRIAKMIVSLFGGSSAAEHPL